MLLCERPRASQRPESSHYEDDTRLCSFLLPQKHSELAMNLSAASHSLLAFPPAPQASQFDTALPLRCYSRFWSCGVSHLRMGFCTAWQKTFSVPSWWKAVGPQEETGLLAPVIYRVSPSHHLRILLFLLFKKEQCPQIQLKPKHGHQTMCSSSSPVQTFLSDCQSPACKAVMLCCWATRTTLFCYSGNHEPLIDA